MRNIVLLGYSNSGKDTAAKLIKQLRPEYRVIKFSSIVKEKFSQYLGIPVEDMESSNRDSITLDKLGLPHHSLLDMLVLSYHIFQAVDPDYMPNRVINKLSSLGSYLFTDVRSVAEVGHLHKHVPNLLVILLDRTTSTPRSSDKQLPMIVAKFAKLGHTVHIVHNNTTEKGLLDRLEELL